LKELIKQVGVALLAGQYEQQALPEHGEEPDVEDQLQDVEQLKHGRLGSIDEN